MPELPEVETVARLIAPRLEGRRIESTDVRWRRTLGGPTPRAFERAVVGATARRVRRRGKFVVVELEREGASVGALVVHLRMTGRLHVDPDTAPDPDWLRLRCELDGGQRLDFVDVRKFGRFSFHRDPEERLAGLGPEPLGESFTREWLRDGLRERRRMLKPLLLDQTFVAGLGNIYVDESLFLARLHPETRSDRVSARKAFALHAAIRGVLAEAIEREGSSFDPFYRTPEGNPGSYQDRFRVYGRDGKDCPRCDGVVRRTVVGQRGTHLCPRCQRRR